MIEGIKPSSKVGMRKSAKLFAFLKERRTVNVSTARGGWDLDAEAIETSVPTRNAIFAYGKLIALMQRAIRSERNTKITLTAREYADEHTKVMLEIETHLDMLLFREELPKQAKFSLLALQLQEL